MIRTLSRYCLRNTLQFATTKRKEEKKKKKKKKTYYRHETDELATFEVDESRWSVIRTEEKKNNNTCFRICNR